MSEPFDPTTLPQTIPTDRREVAAALCAATWREAPADNHYLTDPEFRDEWDRAAVFAMDLLNGRDEDLLTAHLADTEVSHSRLAAALCEAKQGATARANAYLDDENEGAFKDEYERGAALLQTWLDSGMADGPWKIVLLTEKVFAGRSVRMAEVVAERVPSESLADRICVELNDLLAEGTYIFMPMCQPLSSVI